MGGAKVCIFISTALNCIQRALYSFSQETKTRDSDAGIQAKIHRHRGTSIVVMFVVISSRLHLHSRCACLGDQTKPEAPIPL